jgi:CDP-diglyceride synthetase
MASDDKTQTGFLYAVLAFCLTGILLEVILMIFQGTIWGIWSFIIVFLISSAAAVGGFFLGKMFG